MATYFLDENALQGRGELVAIYCQNTMIGLGSVALTVVMSISTERGVPHRKGEITG